MKSEWTNKWASVSSSSPMFTTLYFAHFFFNLLFFFAVFVYYDWVYSTHFQMCSFSLWNFSKWYSVLLCTRCVFNIYFLLSPLISFYFHFSSFLYCIRCVYIFVDFHMLLIRSFSLSSLHSHLFASIRMLRIPVAFFPTYVCYSAAAHRWWVWPCTYRIYDKITFAHRYKHKPSTVIHRLNERECLCVSVSIVCRSIEKQLVK